MLSSPNDKLEAQQCQQWLYSLLARGVYVLSSEMQCCSVFSELYFSAIIPHGTDIN
ncbi:hypothetical protein [Moorena sp. SIO3H5]|uniref:hypothetical protein n=1 Tax=Moorena sp. SIO3H5 TaxID=2607834 RepID=UPI0013BE4A11|nr:hypothetical protein [Moorena sp. SIO3H5]NEO69076.1 hypothetical protein [Moorena sp. SIO3H5]